MQKRAAGRSLLALHTILGKEVVMAPPYSVTRRSGTEAGPTHVSDRWMKGVLERVPVYVTDAEIAADTGAI
jgi:hypothetical protein